jgi:hypothetical protein
MHLLIAGSPSVALPGADHARPDQDQAVSRLSNVKPRRDATGHDETKPAARVGAAVQLPLARPTRLRKVGHHVAASRARRVVSAQVPPRT